MTMDDEPVDLDDRRGMAAQKATETRRQERQAFQAAQDDLRHRRDELESLLAAAPAETWPDVAVKALYLIRLFAATPEAEDPRRMKLIEHTIADLRRLSDSEQTNP